MGYSSIVGVLLVFLTRKQIRMLLSSLFAPLSEEFF